MTSITIASDYVVPEELILKLLSGSTCYALWIGNLGKHWRLTKKRVPDLELIPAISVEVQNLLFRSLKKQNKPKPSNQLIVQWALHPTWQHALTNWVGHCVHRFLVLVGYLMFYLCTLLPTRIYLDMHVTCLKRRHSPHVWMCVHPRRSPIMQADIRIQSWHIGHSYERRCWHFSAKEMPCSHLRNLQADSRQEGSREQESHIHLKTEKVSNPDLSYI